MQLTASEKGECGGLVGVEVTVNLVKELLGTYGSLDEDGRVVLDEPQLDYVAKVIVLALV